MRRTSISNFNFENFAEKELVDKFSLWMLRVIFKLNTIDELISKDSDIRDEKIACFLGLEKFIIQDEINRNEVITFLREKLNKLEQRKRFTTLPVLKSNLKNIADIAQLNEKEIQLLEFSIFVEQYDILDHCMDFLGRSLNTSQTKRILSIVLDIPTKDIEKIFSSKSKLSKSSLLTLSVKYTGSLKDNIEFITDTFSDNMLSCKQDMETILKEVIYRCEKTDLKINDFKYLNNELEILLPYLKKSIENSKKGVNILLYGVPGTGKTELSKAIANELETSLYEISYCDEDDEPIEGTNRLRAYKFAQSLLSNKNAFLMFDEVEDVLNSGNNPFSNRQQNKAWINRILENNTIPTIWITNNINCVDNAIVRRFDMSIEMPIPSKVKRKEILNKYSKSQISQELISTMCVNENIAPALISRASNILSTIEIEDKDKAFEMIIQNTLKAQGHEYRKQNNMMLPKTYKTSYINCDIDLERLSYGIKENPNARLCLYGPAGTGKSAYGKYIADFLDKPLIIKKGSDLLGMFVGQTEQNIARAFEEAKEEDAVLVFDEVDSFLANRENANRNWEITQVNEMLVQMENFDGIFIATTNLMDNLDKASLRRFDLKLEFDFLKPEQAWELFLNECKNLNIENPENAQNQIKSLNCLTPGDFAAVLRQNRFRPIENSLDFYERLKGEVDVKDSIKTKSMGFIN